MSDSAEALAERGNRGFQVLARLRPGTTVAAAQQELDVDLAAARSSAYPATNEKRGVEVSPLDVELVGNFRPGLRLLDGGGRIRAADCLRQCRQPTARPVGGAAARDCRAHRDWRGLVEAAASDDHGEHGLDGDCGGRRDRRWPSSRFRLLPELAPVSFPSFVQPHVNARVAIFTVARVRALRAGPGPGACGARTHRPSCGGVEGFRAREQRDSGRRGVRRGLIVAEVALAVVLLVGAGLMMRTVQHLAAIDPGFNPSNVLTARVSIPRARRRRRLPMRLRRSSCRRGSSSSVFARLPGVSAASLVSDPPLSGLSSAVFYAAEGQPAMNAQQRPRALRPPGDARFLRDAADSASRRPDVSRARDDPAGRRRDRQRERRHTVLARPERDRQAHQAGWSRLLQSLVDHRRHRRRSEIPRTARQSDPRS